jgi:predicted MFS family arabinose efflux permease
MRRKGLWRQPDFLKLWAGQAISEIGSRISRTAVPLTAVLVLGASEFQMGILTGAGAATVLLFGLFAGAWADRLRRRPILIAADLGRAAVLGSIPVAAALGRLTIGHLYVVAAASGVLTVLFDVAYQAYLPSLVERENLLEGNSKLALSGSVAEVAGPGLAGLLVEWITAPMAILFDAVSFLCSALSLWRIRKPEQPPERRPEPHLGREIAEGLRAAWSDPLLRALAARTITAAFFLGFPGSLYILFVMRELGLKPALLGLIIAVGGVASFAGALLAERLARRFGCGRTLIGSAVVIGAASVLVPLARGSVTAAAAFLIAAQLGDVAWPVYSINETSLRQAITPDHLLGRVNAAMHLLFWGVLPAGALAGGALAQTIGMRATLFGGALGVLLSALWLALSPVRSAHQLPQAASIAKKD